MGEFALRGSGLGCLIRASLSLVAGLSLVWAIPTAATATAASIQPNAWLACNYHLSANSGSRVMVQETTSGGLDPSSSYIFDATHQSSTGSVTFSDSFDSDASGSSGPPRASAVTSGTNSASTTVGDGYSWTLYESVVQQGYVAVQSGLLTLGSPTGCASVEITHSPSAISRSSTASFTIGTSNATGAMCRWDTDPAQACSSANPITRTGLSDGSHTFWAGVSNTTGGGGAEVTFTWTIDTSAPFVGLTTPTTDFTLSPVQTVKWAGVDSGTGTGIAYYQMRTRHAAWNGGLSAWSYGAHLSAATTHVNAALSPGVDTCFSVQAVDHAGNASGWSPQRCTARPLDDPALVASTGWSRLTNSLDYLSTFTASTHSRATLTRAGAQFVQIALVATRCPTCGSVAVYSGSTLLGTVNLAHSTTIHQAIFLLPVVSLRTATITIRVLTSGKTIQIDGLGIRRT